MNAMGMAEWLRRRALRDPGHPALTFAGETLSYAALQKRVEEFADLLAAQGTTQGDRVAYLGFNHSQFLIAMFAANRLGATFVPLNFRLTGSELAYIVTDSAPRILISDDAHLESIDDLRGSLPCEVYIRFGADARGWRGIDSLLAEPNPAVREVAVDVDDPACILYTSGTTGRPKGAILTHRNFWSNNVNWMLAVNYNAEDVALTSAPLFHSGGLCVITLPTLMAGGHVVLQEQFQPGAFLAAIEEHRITSIFCVPAMMLFASQHEHFASTDFSSVRIIVAGGAPVPEPLLRLYGEHGVPVSQCWGLTEVATGATFLSTELALEKLGSCGVAGMLNEVRLIDFEGNPLATPNVPGELCVRGDTVSPGYWNLPEATAEATGADGWFRTGDVAYQDEDGYFFICDRLKDMIISGGENVYPAEVESVLYDHVSIAEVAVIGAPDERWGERVVAVVALKPNTGLELEQLREFAASRLARFKLPLELRIVTALPRNTTGKVLKQNLRAGVPVEA
ncbi:acyl-CoA synthetase [Subtercola boreus]|uniref:Acyl-CoA synthetase n=1 Tax=Subtercola boreus TaxID=120213 RepID=A0A3E0VPQ9_9MICO|nr:long-chain fatty acid--CoA ligase [Subtercola boreus]RFA10837.1 acyl-CoA synthetase [Subtercola boreus]TQL55581.1 fatty-acyl-CoA synthase [Subtercola boreus]